MTDATVAELEAAVAKLEGEVTAAQAAAESNVLTSQQTALAKVQKEYQDACEALREHNAAILSIGNG